MYKIYKFYKGCVIFQSASVQIPVDASASMDQREATSNKGHTNNAHRPDEEANAGTTTRYNLK